MRFEAMTMCVVCVASLLSAAGCKQSKTQSKPKPEPRENVNADVASDAQAAENPEPVPTKLPPGHPPISTSPKAAPSAPTTGGDKPTEWSGEGVSWTIPAGWSQDIGSGMRFATLRPAAGEPEIAVSNFPGDVGGLLANVNRWRGQIGLDPVTEDDLPNETREVMVGEVKAVLADLGGEKPDDQKVLALSIPHGGKTWFVKMSGPAKVLDDHEEEFMTFAQSIRLSP